MYDNVNDLVEGYLNECKGHATRRGFAEYVGISRTTIDNAIRGQFNGRYYTLKPHASRKFANKDFCIIRQLFSQERTKNEDYNNKGQRERDD